MIQLNESSNQYLHCIEFHIGEIFEGFEICIFLYVLMVLQESLEQEKSNSNNLFGIQFYLKNRSNVHVNRIIHVITLQIFFTLPI